MWRYFFVRYSQCFFQLQNIVNASTDEWRLIELKKKKCIIEKRSATREKGKLLLSKHYLSLIHIKSLQKGC
jgi:hypothetical protein